METERIMPALFISHSSPMIVDEQAKRLDWFEWAKRLPTPDAILVISAHWGSRGLWIGKPQNGELLYDYFGFPERLYTLKYGAPVAEHLAETVHDLLSPHFEVREKQRGWDHGVFIPLLCMYPDAEIPVLQLSLPLDFAQTELFRLGELLAPLRSSGVLIVGSGGIVHNLGRVDFADREEPEEWAVEFDRWVVRAVEERNWSDLVNFRNAAPNLQLAHPSDEHFLPLLTVCGAAKPDEKVSFPVEGFEYGTLSRRCVQFG